MKSLINNEKGEEGRKIKENGDCDATEMKQEKERGVFFHIFVKAES